MDTGQSVRQQINTHFHASQVLFPFLTREALQNEGHGSTFPLSNILMKLKNASEMPFSGEAKRAPSSDREDDLLHCAGAEQLRSGRRGRNSFLCYRDAQRTIMMTENFQSEISCLSPYIPQTETLNIRFIPFIDGHKHVYAFTQC